ncbi:hypothetical protein VNO80_15936 [Phaseolus coccineus]|uniref:Uncharacterized protein n=1 Tax=Phaseolus coccineus TaxID=3886 RepID=A0AAN9R2Q7_PHACN
MFSIWLMMYDVVKHRMLVELVGFDDNFDVIPMEQWFILGCMQIDGEERKVLDFHKDARKEDVDVYFGLPRYTNSTFRSPTTNEVYFFLRDKYVRVYYTPGQVTQTNDKFLTDLGWIGYGFPSFQYNIFGSYGIFSSFDTEGNEAYISRDYVCSYIDYANDKILSGPIRIELMFSILEGTMFKDGIDSTFRSSKGKEVYLFHGNKYCCMDYDSKQLVEPICNITDGYPILKGTIFEDRIDASFVSHNENQAYLFKEENYVLMNFTPGSTDDTLVDIVKSIVDGWSCFKGILPLEDRQADYTSDEFDFEE